MAQKSLQFNDWAREDILEEEIKKVENQIKLLDQRIFNLQFECAKYDFLSSVNKSYANKDKTQEQNKRGKEITTLEDERKEVANVLARYTAEKRKIYINSY